MRSTGCWSTRVPSWRWMERVSRKICVELGSIASTCKAPRTGREVKEWGIHFTVTKAIAIGHRVRAYPRNERARTLPTAPRRVKKMTGKAPRGRLICTSSQPGGSLSHDAPIAGTRIAA